MSTPAASYPFTVDNSYGQSVTVYLTTCQPVSDPPSTDSSAYLPIYTSLGTVESGSGSFSTSEPIARVVIARSADQFPLKLAVVDALNPPTQSVTVASADEAVTDSCWTFYKSFASQPYSPVALQFNDLILNNNDPTQLNTQVAAFFSQNGYPGVDFGTFSIVSYWATNSLYAFPGSYYCYQPQTANSQFILPTEVCAMLEIANGSATYTPTGGSGTALNLSNTALNSDAGVSPQVSFTGVVRDLTLEGQPNTIVMCFVGTVGGTQTIAQPYQNPQLPWYAVAYDLVYGSFVLVQFAMAMDMAVSILKGVANGMQWLADNSSKLLDNVRSWANDTGDEVAPDTELGPDVDPINVDVDVDVDIDIDVDIDVDVDTDVDVEPGMVDGLVNTIGGWILTKALPALLEMAVISFAFDTAGKLLDAWKTADAKAIANLQPRQSTGLGLLINYMLDDSKPVSDRWNTYADYLQQSGVDNASAQMSVTTIQMTQNTTADTALANWRWSTSDEQAAVAAMAPFTGAQMYQAFQALGAYTYNGQPLPVKVGASVAMQYLKA
jgi:hypothetical protein